MTESEYRKIIIEMIKKIKKLAFLKLIYTVVRTCFEKENEE